MQELSSSEQARLRSAYPFCIARGFYQEVIDAYVTVAARPLCLTANDVYIAARRELRNQWAQEADPAQRERYQRSLLLLQDFKLSSRTYAARVKQIVMENREGNR